MTIDELAQAIRSIDDWRSLGDGGLAEKLHPAIPGLEAMADLEAALDKEWAYSAELKQQLAAAREAYEALCDLVVESPRGFVEQVWTRKVTHEVTMDVMGVDLDLTGQTFRLVDEAALATLQRDRQP